MNNGIEIWKDVPNFEGYYIVSNFGNVKNKNNKFIKGTINMDGYLQITLCKNSIKKNYTIHSLVAFVFLGHVYKSHERIIDHIDNNKLNNELRNLQIVTNRYNCSKDKKAVKKCTSKYTGVLWYKKNKKWLASYQLNRKTKHIGYYDSELEAHEAYQKALSEIEQIKKAKNL